eukprot:Sspe_Gene.64859::Locus_38420_Transcript_1_1_Confidence_1.000_Length_310::g.64859::m.64859
MTYSMKATQTNNESMVKALEDHWATWYTQEDFTRIHDEMKLNTIRLPLGWWYFAEAANLSATPYLVPAQRINDTAHPINKVMAMAKKAGLKVIVDLHGAPCSQ